MQDQYHNSKNFQLAWGRLQNTQCSLSCSSANRVIQVVAKFQTSNFVFNKAATDFQIHTAFSSPQVIQIPKEQIHSQLLTTSWAVCRVVYTSKMYFADDLPYEVTNYPNCPTQTDIQTPLTLPNRVVFTASNYYTLHCLQDRIYV